MIIDTHCHLDDLRYEEGLASVLERAESHGVEKFIIPGADQRTLPGAVELLEKYDHVYFAVGAHPYHAKYYGRALLSPYVEHEKCVAIGECGLDYFRLPEGEGLYLHIKRMEMAYHEYNKCEYELTKHISLRQLDPRELLKLKVEGSCEVTIPEWLFDMDCPGHYMCRIKTVSLSIPCVVGSYTSINCTLSLQKSTIRKSSEGDYERGEEDIRFVDNYGTIQSIVTSNAQNDSGVFELNLRDEKYLPFEGAGAESTWRLELPSEFRQFDYSTISDVIIHMRYTAREGGGLLRSGENGDGGAEGYMKKLVK